MPTLGSAADPTDGEGRDLVLGLDEAGRGSLLGPLVVGGFWMRRSDVPRLADLGVRDSKLLTPERRESIYGELTRWGTRGSISLSPATVDASVREKELNLLEARAFARLIGRARPDHAYVDACDPVAGRFGRLVGGLSTHRCRVTAQHRADRDLLIVGAASIVAKVRRDRALSRLRRRLGDSIGSGYPANDRTREFVREHFRSGVDRPAWLRHSWRTLETLKAPLPTRALESFPT